MLATRRIQLSLLLASALAACGGTVGLAPGDSGTDSEPSSVDAQPHDASADAGDSTTTPPYDGGRFGGGDTTGPPPPPVPDAAPEDAADASLDGGGICGTATCSNGCCNGVGQCVDPPTAQQCGGRGMPCQTCGANQICGDSIGCVTMQPTCDSTNCAGCCVGTPPNTACQAGTDHYFCGSSGAACTVCGPNEDCRPLLFDAGGFCQANTTCGPSNCTGCCIGNVCAQGDQPNACGIGGATCMNCFSDICVTGGCVCGVPTGVDCDARGTPTED